MPTSESTTHAAQVRESLHNLAHTTRRINDPSEIYDVLGNLSLAVNSLAQSLHQIAKIHDDLEPGRARVAESPRSGRATSYAVAWEVHRSAEMLTQVAKGIDRAHQDESRIAYAPPDPLLVDAPTSRATTNIRLHQ